MSFWVLDAVPNQSTYFLCDELLVNAMHYSVSVLSKAMQAHGLTPPTEPMKDESPVFDWIMESSDNLWWLLTQLESYGQELYIRRGYICGRHELERHTPTFCEFYATLGSDPGTDFPNVTGIDMLEDDCIHKIYCDKLAQELRTMKPAPTWGLESGCSIPGRDPIEFKIEMMYIAHNRTHPHLSMTQRRP